MSATRNCPARGNPLPADAPAGLCPRCLLAGGFATAASPPTTDFEPPKVAELAPLFPQLEIIELLGAGGMGAVYKARQTHLDRLVALKVMPPRDDPAFAERFTREARTLAKLNDPGIVQVFDFGQAGGHSYIVMEYVEGVNLRQAERAGTMTPVEALAVVPQICAALQFAHEAGVVHRDIKPENILLDAKGRVKIADFGLAKLLGAIGPQHLTGTHQAMGTMHYMAPEQWEKPATVDHRADIYSLGVVFYELLTGELPLGRFAPPSEKVQVDVRLDQVVLRALEKEPERRYQQASEVKTDVERISGAVAPERPSEPPPLPAQPVVRARHGLFRHVGLPTLIVFAIWLVALWAVMSEANRATREAAEARARHEPGGGSVPALVGNLVVFGVGFLGPITAAVLFVRWLRMTPRPQHPTGFWALAGVLILTTALACGVVVGSRTLRIHSSARDQIIGTWGTAFSDGRIEFKTDGVFAFYYHEADPQSPGKASPDAPEKCVLGKFMWVDDETIEFRSIGGPQLRLQFVDGNTVRTIEGLVIHLKVISDGPAFVVLNNGEMIARLRRIR